MFVYTSNMMSSLFIVWRAKFRKKFSLYCTWEPGLNNFFTDEFEENEIEELPEEIEVKKIRLKQS